MSSYLFRIKFHVLVWPGKPLSLPPLGSFSDAPRPALNVPKCRVVQCLTDLGASHVCPGSPCLPRPPRFCMFAFPNLSSINIHPLLLVLFFMFLDYVPACLPLCIIWLSKIKWRHRIYKTENHPLLNNDEGPHCMSISWGQISLEN